MPKNTQLLWIAEAEARRLREATMTQHAVSEPQASVVATIHGSARYNRWLRLVARLTPGDDSRAVPVKPAAPEACRAGSRDDRGAAGRSPEARRG